MYSIPSSINPGGEQANISNAILLFTVFALLFLNKMHDYFFFDKRKNRSCCFGHIESDIRDGVFAELGKQRDDGFVQIVSCEELRHLLERAREEKKKEIRS